VKKLVRSEGRKEVGRRDDFFPVPEPGETFELDQLPGVGSHDRLVKHLHLAVLKEIPVALVVGEGDRTKARLPRVLLQGRKSRPEGA